MAYNVSTLANMLRQEQANSLKTMPERDMYEMIRAHFESHPTLPGEKEMKDRVNQLLNEMNETGFEPAGKTPFDNDGATGRTFICDEHSGIC